MKLPQVNSRIFSHRLNDIGDLIANRLETSTNNVMLGGERRQAADNAANEKLKYQLYWTGGEISRYSEINPVFFLFIKVNDMQFAMIKF